MAFGTQKNIILDLYNDKYVSTRVSQYDINSRDIIIQITDNGVPYKVDLSKISVKIKYSKSDGNIVLNDILPENILSDGTIKLTLTEQMCASFGMNEAELMLIDLNTTKVIHTMHFVVNVKKSVIDNKEITSKDEFTTLENALVRIENALVRLDNVLDNLKPITKSQIDELF